MLQENIRLEFLVSATDPGIIKSISQVNKCIIARYLL